MLLGLRWIRKGLDLSSCIIMHIGCPDKMVPDKMARTKWYGQNGTDKMVYAQNGMGQNGMDKMVWTKWYRQNGTDKMVVIFGIDYKSSEFNSYLVTKIHNEMINTQRKPKRLKVKAGLMKKSYCQWEWN